jgi:hypothetical protein
MMILPGFTGIPGVIKYPAYLEFPLRGDEGGFFENLKNYRHAHSGYSLPENTPAQDRGCICYADNSA